MNDDDEVPCVRPVRYPAADRSVFDVRFPNASYAKSVHPGAGPPTCDHDVGIASTSIDTSLADHSAHALW